MKRNLHFFVCFAAFLLVQQAFAQIHWYDQQSQNKDKYFVAAGYGVGTARWYSTLTKTSLYDHTGNSVESGTFKFRAKNTTTFYDLNVMFPNGNIRMGLGLDFEKFYITELKLLESVQKSKVILYDETFRFDKIFAQFEVPFWPNSRAKYSLSANLRVGFFSFNNVDRINFFGADALASSVFTSLSPVGDVQIYPCVYLFVQPLFEYKYFKNPAVDVNGLVQHNIFTYSALIGIRFDPSAMDPYK